MLSQEQKVLVIRDWAGMCNVVAVSTTDTLSTWIEAKRQSVEKYPGCISVSVQHSVDSVLFTMKTEHFTRKYHYFWEEYPVQ